MKTKNLIFMALLAFANCGGPELIDFSSATPSENDGFENGTANVTVSDGSSTREYPGIRTNVHYDDVDDSLEITIFGEDESGDYECILFLAVPNASTLASGATIAIDDDTLYGSMSYGASDNDADTSASFTSLTSGELEIEQICLDTADCANAASYTVTFTQNGTTMSVTGDYESDYLSLD